MKIVLLNSFIIPSAILISLLFTFAFAHFSRRGPWIALLLFFFIIFLVSWAGHLWIKPFGPIVAGMTPFPMIFVAVIFTFLIAALSPPSKIVDEDETKITEQEKSVYNIGMYFWLLILILVAVIAIGYYNLPLELIK